MLLLPSVPGSNAARLPEFTGRNIEMYGQVREAADGSSSEVLQDLQGFWIFKSYKVSILGIQYRRNLVANSSTCELKSMYLADCVSLDQLAVSFSPRREADGGASDQTRVDVDPSTNISWRERRASCPWP